MHGSHNAIVEAPSLECHRAYIFRLFRFRIILFSEIGFCMASCSYIYMYVYIYICQDGGAVGFVEFTKL